MPSILSYIKMELRLKIHISKAGCSWGNLWFISLQRTEKILQEGVSCREGEPESGGSKSADRIWINLVGQDPLVQAPRESEERNQARIWPRPLVITSHGQEGEERCCIRAASGVPHFQAATLHPWFCHTASPCAVGGSVLLPVRRFCVPMLHVTSTGCLGSSAAPKHPPHCNMCRVWKCSLSI